MRSRKEFNKARHNAARNDPVDGWIVFLGEELSELCSSFDLAGWIIGEYGLDYLWRQLGCSIRISKRPRSVWLRMPTGVATEVNM